MPLSEALKNFFLSLAFPIPCALCSKIQGLTLCVACSKVLANARHCAVCHRPINTFGCQECFQSLGLDGIKILGFYKDWGAYILAGKDGRMPPIAWWNFLPQEFRSSELGIVFVPSSRNKHWMEQGLPEALYSRTLPALERNPGKLSQKLLNLKEREKNGVNLFRIRDDCGKKFSRILLVDDVLSTGTSIRTCVKLLRSLGYEKIFCFIIAFQGRDKE